MRPWAKFGQFAAALPVAVGLVAALGAARLTHQFPRAAASPGLLTPFLRPVLALALEAGTLIALSFALLSVLSRATVSGPSARARATLLLIGLAALVLMGAELIPRGTERPGLFANQLVQSARQSCGASGRVPVPLLGLSVRCAAPRRIEGPMPGAGKVQLAMDELTFSDDLRRVEISALELSSSGSLRVRLRADRAKVSGLAPWARSPRLSILARLAILTALGVGLWLAAALLVQPLSPTVGERATATRSVFERARGLLVYVLFALPGAGTAAAFISLDQAQAEPALYAGAGLLGVVALALVAWLLRRAPQIAGSFRDF